MRHDEQQGGVIGELDLDLGVGVLAKQLVLLDRHHLAVCGTVDEHARHGADIETGGLGRAVAAVALHQVVLHAATAREDVGQSGGDALSVGALPDRLKGDAVGVVDRVEGDGGRGVELHRQEDVDVADPGDDDAPLDALGLGEG